MSERTRSSHIRSLRYRAEHYAALSRELGRLADTLQAEPGLFPDGLDSYLVEPFDMSEATEIRAVFRALRIEAERLRVARVAEDFRNMAMMRPGIASACGAAALHLERRPWLVDHAEGITQTVVRWKDNGRWKDNEVLGWLIDFVAQETQEEAESRIAREANEWHRKQPADEAITA